jgi:hypothetical protein
MNVATPRQLRARHACSCRGVKCSPVRDSGDDSSRGESREREIADGVQDSTCSPSVTVHPRKATSALQSPAMLTSRTVGKSKLRSNGTQGQSQAGLVDEANGDERRTKEMPQVALRFRNRGLAPVGSGLPHPSTWRSQDAYSLHTLGVQPLYPWLGRLGHFRK